MLGNAAKITKGVAGGIKAGGKSASKIAKSGTKKAWKKTKEYVDKELEEVGKELPSVKKGKDWLVEQAAAAKKSAKKISKDIKAGYKEASGEAEKIAQAKAAEKAAKKAGKAEAKPKPEKKEKKGHPLLKGAALVGAGAGGAALLGGDGEEDPDTVIERIEKKMRRGQPLTPAEKRMVRLMGE